MEKDINKIKLNPHITIYSVEEKMYTREEVKMFLKRLPNFYHYSIIQQAEMLDEWFEQNVK